MDAPGLLEWAHVRWGEVQCVLVSMPVMRAHYTPIPSVSEKWLARAGGSSLSGRFR
jgi:hypothetical protein